MALSAPRVPHRARPAAELGGQRLAEVSGCADCLQPAGRSISRILPVESPTQAISSLISWRLLTGFKKGVMKLAEYIRKLEKCTEMMLLAIYLQVAAPAGPSKCWFFSV